MIHKASTRLIAVFIVFSMLFSLVACSTSSTAPNPELGDPNEHVEVENIDVETIEIENTLNELITTEVYLEEIVVVENQITELLLEEETIEEVLSCQTIYVPQDNLEEFAENSQATAMFGDGINLKSVLTKVAVGTGVIVTVCVLKKANVPEPVCSIVTAAADQGLRSAGIGTGIGTLFGGLVGFTDELDSSGRTSAILGFALATAGLILASVSLIATIPSGGASSITAATGVKLVIAGISLLAASVAEIQTGYDAIQTFTSTDGFDINWDDIDWNAAGVHIAEQSIEGAANGYMWGAIVGTVYGGADGYDFYHKYNTPYTAYNNRLMQTPNRGGHWTGARGESTFVLDEPIVLSDGTTITEVTYRNCIPDFSPFEKAQVKIPRMTNQRYGTGNNFDQADSALADFWTRINQDGHAWTARDVANYREANGLTWHEMSNMEYMQLVPSEVNQTFTHYGGVAEYNAMIGMEGEEEFG